ncbi:MAG: class I SAM-dependent methyltransferase [Candidatus Algichlamydia australiensis]|nr:class I SAM-dependent methyltransferase [Chlamydiales bacterium]
MASFHRQGVSRSCSRGISHFSADEKFERITDVFMDLMSPSLRFEFERDPEVIAATFDPRTRLEMGLKYACEVPDALDRLGVRRGKVLKEFDQGIWHVNQNKVGGSISLEALLPLNPDKYLSVTAARVIKYLQRHIKNNEPINFFEIGCLSGHDLALIQRDVSKLTNLKVERYIGIDIHRPAMILAGALKSVDARYRGLELNHFDATLEENYSMIPQNNRKVVFCNKLFSAMPPQPGKQAFAHLASILKTGDVALINFTIDDRVTKPVLEMVTKNKVFSTMVVDDITVVKHGDNIIQSIYPRRVLAELFERHQLEVLEYEYIIELKESKSDPQVAPSTIKDSYNRGFFCFVKKREDVKVASVY